MAHTIKCVITDNSSSSASTAFSDTNAWCRDCNVGKDSISEENFDEINFLNNLLFTHQSQEFPQKYVKIQTPSRDQLMLDQEVLIQLVVVSQVVLSDLVFQNLLGVFCRKLNFD